VDEGTESHAVIPRGGVVLHLYSLARRVVVVCWSICWNLAQPEDPLLFVEIEEVDVVDFCVVPDTLFLAAAGPEVPC